MSATIYKVVDVITQKQIKILKRPIYNSVFGISLSLDDILTCILNKATVLEELPSGIKMKLTLNNYKRDNGSGTPESPSESTVPKVSSFPFVSNVLTDADSPYLVTGNAIRQYFLDHGGAGTINISSIDGKTFADSTGGTIKITRGLKLDLPILAVGEFGFTTDEKRLYLGTAEGNMVIPTTTDITDALSAIDAKVTKVEGKGLSSNDYTTEDKEATASIANKVDTDVAVNLQAQLDSVKATVAALQLIVTGVPVSTFSISALTASMSVVEMGTTVNSITFNWTYSGTPTSQQFEGSTLDNALRTTNYTTPVTTTKTFTLSAVAPDASTKTASATVKFLNGVYYGISTSTTYNGALIESLTKILSDTKARTINVNAAGLTDYIYYAVPTRLGVPVFVVGGFEGGFALEATISYTNSKGYAESYDIYRSDNSGLGSTTIVIS